MLFDGRLFAEGLMEEYRKRVQSFGESAGRPPCLAVLKATEDAGAESYLKRKKKVFSTSGAELIIKELDPSVSGSEYLSVIESFNKNENIDAIFIEMPLPSTVSYKMAVSAISPLKDAEGITSDNIAHLFRGNPFIVPSTPMAVVKILEGNKIETAGRRVAIVGRSEVVTKPLALLFLRKGKYGDATVTVCHSKTVNIMGVLQESDIIVSACGNPNFIDGDMLKKYPVLIDVGTGSVKCEKSKSGFKICGDIKLSNPEMYPSFYTPVPGGVGPVTGVMLLENLLIIAENKLKR